MRGMRGGYTSLAVTAGARDCSPQSNGIQVSQYLIMEGGWSISLSGYFDHHHKKCLHGHSDNNYYGLKLSSACLP